MNVGSVSDILIIVDGYWWLELIHSSGIHYITCAGTVIINGYNVGVQV